MASFFQKARDRAQEVAAEFSSSSSHHTDSGDATTASTGNSAGKSSGFTYTGSLPHVLRQGMASVDPRFEATRPLHMMRAALKGVVIDEAALARETKTAAAKTFKWGQDHAAQDRQDGVADEALADITDRLAYILTTLGDLELEHSRRLTQGRTELKRIQVAELELASDRAQRIKIVKELQGLAAERQKPGGTARIDELQAQLTTLEAEAKAREEGLSKLKRQCFQQAFDKQMDSYIEAGEKLALLASYGKLLLREVPVNEPATFPAPKHQIGKGWEGSAKTARIRSLLQPALHSYVSKTTLPTLGDEPAVPSPAQTTSATVSDAASFRTSHAHELAEDERANPGEATVAVTGHPALSSCSEAHNSIPLAQLPEGGSPNPKWNHSPSLIPAVAARPAYEHTCSPPSGSLPQPSQLQQSRLQGRSAYPSAFAGSGHPEEQAVIEETAPPGPTVAETGAVLASSPQGPGPKTGVLERRRPSSNASGAEKPVLPPRPQAAVGTSTSSGPIGNTSPAFLPPSSAATQIHARIRRDGTITRRGVDHDFAQAEAEQLPAYAEVANDSAGAGNCAGTI